VVERLAPIHDAQLLTYLRLGRYPIGVLLNFNCLRLKDGIRRLIGFPPRPSASSAPPW
jgi:GxxExxY protein